MKTSLLIAAEKPNERLLKIAYALKSKGVSVAGVFNKIANSVELGRYFDFLRFEPDTNELAAVVQRFPCDLVHLHSYSYDKTCLDILLKTTKKIIYDPKDVYAGILDADGLNHPRGAVDGQIHLLTKSAGLVLRDGQAHLSARLGKYKLASKRILFPDFCWPVDFYPKQVRHFDAMNFNSLRLVFIGNFWPETQPPHWTGAGQIFNFKTLLDKGHSIDVYPTSYMAVWDFSEYHDLASAYPGRFRFMPHCLEYELVVKKLPQYDAGIFFPQEGFIERPTTYWHASLHRYGVGARIFDFISAGLLTIVSFQQRSKHRFVHAGLAVKLDQEPLGVALDKLSYKFREAIYGEDRLKLMKKISIDAYTDRLLNFYRKV